MTDVPTAHISTMPEGGTAQPPAVAAGGTAAAPQQQQPPTTPPVANIDTEQPLDETDADLTLTDDFTAEIKAELKNLVQYRANERRLITRTVNDHTHENCDRLEGSKLVEHLNSLTARLTARYEAVKDLNAKVVAKLPHDKQAADYDKQYDYELKVFDALETVKTRQQQLRDDAAAVSSPQPASIPSSQLQNLSKFLNLPKVNVPIIPKDTTKFLSWYDQFNSTIHDVSFLTDVVKLQYLRQSCQQNFPTIIDHFPTAGGDNYERTRQVIFERLYNPRVIAYSLINNFISASQIKPDNGSSILRMVEQIRGMIADLHKLNVNTQNWDCIIMCILTDKMDEVTRREYLTRHPSKDIPYLAHCITFLEERGIALSVLHKNSEPGDDTKKKPNNQNNQSLAHKQLAATAQLVAAAQNLTSANATPPTPCMKKKDSGKETMEDPGLCLLR